MLFHQKELIQPVKVGKPDARFGTFLLEQFGGATGELTAALQYWVQSFHVENAGIRDMLQDVSKCRPCEILSQRHVAASINSISGAAPPVTFRSPQAHFSMSPPRLRDLQSGHP